MNAVVLRPLPYRDAGRLAVLWKIVPAKNHEWDFTSYPVFAEWQRRNHAFDDIALVSRLHYFTVAAPEGPEQFDAVLVSASFFRMLGVAPELGRFYTIEDERQRAQVIVLSHAFWRRWFGGSRGALGQSVQVNGRTLRVIGVMPREFQFPYRETQFWGLNTADERWPKWQTIRFADAFFGLGRLKPGVSVDQAQAEISAISRRLAHEFPETDTGIDVRVVPLSIQITGLPVREALWILFGAVLFVLLIACMNVAGLFLVRGAARQQEFAVRAALGAGRGRLIRPMVTEGAVLAMLAAIIGIGLAAAGIRTLIAFGPADVARIQETSIDMLVLVFALAVSFAAVFIFALAPAWKLSDFTLSGGIKRFQRSMSGRALVIAELALSLVLLTAAGLLIRSFAAIENVDPGFRPERVLSMKITLPDTRSKERATAFFEEAIRRVESLPGVSGAALGGVFSGDRLPNINIILEDRPTQIYTDLTGGYDVSDRYFGLLGIPLLSGRLFSALDRRDSPRAAIINQTMARRFWPGEDPVGKRFKGNLPGMLEKTPWCTVVGLVADTVPNGRESRIIPMMYLSHRQMAWAYAQEFLVRTSIAEPLQLASAVTREIRSIDKMALRSGVTTLEAHMDQLNAPRRFQTWLLALFASIGLLLAAMGVFGLVHYSVARRTAEMGIRLALGAQPRSVLALVLRQGLTLAVMGVALGLIGASWTARLLAGWLYGITPFDPLTIAAVSGLLIVVVAAASYLPARKAARIDPIQALRHE